MERYASIERESGIAFHRQNGFLAVGPKGSAFVEDNKRTAKARGAAVRVLEGSSAIAAAVGGSFRPTSSLGPLEGVLEGDGAGSINPRRLVAAQLRLAQRHGARLVRDVVTRVRRRGPADYTVETRASGAFPTASVVLCPGAFLLNQDLFPSPLRVPDVKVMRSMLIRVPVRSPALLFRHWDPAAPLPSVMAQLEADERAAAEKQGYHSHPRFLWAMAPIPYPDGTAYLKFGDSADFWQQECRSGAEATEWFRCKDGGRGAWEELRPRAERLAKRASQLFPGLDTSGYVMDGCCVGTTASERPLVEALEAGFVFVGGGNGYAAKSSDEIGRLAALSVLGRPWDTTPHSPLRPHVFRQKAQSKV